MYKEGSNQNGHLVKFPPIIDELRNPGRAVSDKKNTTKFWRTLLALFDALEMSFFLSTHSFDEIKKAVEAKI